MLRRDPRTECYQRLVAVSDNVVQVEHTDAWEQEKRARVSEMCLEAASIRQGRGVAQAAAKQSMQDWNVRKENMPPDTSCKSDARAPGKHVRRQQITEFTCSRQQGRDDTLASQKFRTALSSHKRSFRTQSPCAVPTKRPALANEKDTATAPSAPGTTRFGKKSWRPGPWPESLEEGGCDRQQGLVVKHLGTKADIPPAWQQAITEAKSKGRIREGAENRASQLSKMMETLGRKACARVSHEAYIKALEKDLTAKAAIKTVERLTKLSRSRRARLQQGTMGIGGCSTSTQNRMESMDNERVRRSVYFRQGYSQANTEMRQEQVDVGSAVRLPFAELEPGYFSKSENC